MKILFLGDVVGVSGCSMILNNLLSQIENKNIDFENIEQTPEMADGTAIDEEIDIIFVLVDYQMPEMTGAELIRKIKSKYKDLNCLMLSGQANSTQISELEKDNLLDKFIEKPWDEDELRDAVSKLVAAKTLS